MNDNRAAAQELQGQVLAAARRGQERVARSVRTAAQQIRPQLASLPRPTISISALPTPAQLREKAPEFVSKLPAKLPARIQTRLPNRLQNRLPSPEQLRTSAQEFAGHARSVQRLVTDQVMSVATPLAHQAAARLSQVGAQTASDQAATEAGTTTKVSRVTVTKNAKPSEAAAESKPSAKPSAKATTTAKGAKTGSTAASESAKPGTRSSSSKPKTDPADK